MTSNRLINVMLVDDSAVVRSILGEIIDNETDMRVMATASDPIIAVQKLKEKVPDVIILDIEMPRMDGLTFLKKLMSQHPLPVIICSSVVSEANNLNTAIELGAVDVISKPQANTGEFLREAKVLVTDAIRAAYLAKPKKLIRPIQKKLTADVILPEHKQSQTKVLTERVVVVGASTGGTEALRLLLEDLPTNVPGIAIVQHMPKRFTATFAKRLDQLCNIKVVEAKNGDRMQPGKALLAPGDQHMLLKRRNNEYYVELKDGPLVSRHRPSIDVLFRSAARYAGPNATAIIMTGMGADGANGIQEIKDAGGVTYAQDEATSVVFGMAKEAIKKGGVKQVLPLHELPNAILDPRMSKI